MKSQIQNLQIPVGRAVHTWNREAGWEKTGSLFTGPPVRVASGQVSKSISWLLREKSGFDSLRALTLRDAFNNPHMIVQYTALCGDI